MISKLVYPLGVVKYCRNYSDLRLVFYHGIGCSTSPCLRFLYDEISIDVFESQIDFLINNYEILSLHEALNNINDKPYSLKKPICSISFDDGLQSVYKKAFPILKQKKIPAMVFLSTSVIGNISLLWTHLINYLISEFGIKTITILFNKYKSLLLEEAPENEFYIQDWYKKNYENNLENKLLSKVLTHLNLSLSEIAQEQNLYLSWKEIEEMEKYDFTFCSHTSNHTPLAYLKNEELRKSEIFDAYSILRDRKMNLDYVSFPFGMRSDYGEKAIEDAFRIGHKYVLEVGYGTNNHNKAGKSRILARVGLGCVDSRSYNLFSAIELRPRVKTFIKGIA